MRSCTKLINKTLSLSKQICLLCANCAQAKTAFRFDKLSTFGFLCESKSKAAAANEIEWFEIALYLRENRKRILLLLYLSCLLAFFSFQDKQSKEFDKAMK